MKKTITTAAALAIFVISSSIFNSFRIYYTLLSFAIALILISHLGPRKLRKPTRIFTFLIALLVALAAIVPNIVTPNSDEFKKLRLANMKIQTGPINRSVSNFTRIGAQANAKRTFFKEEPRLLDLLCPEDLSAQYLFYKDHQDNDLIMDPWTGRRMQCALVWVNLTYIGNSKRCIVSNSSVIFDSIKTNSGKIFMEQIRGDSIYTYQLSSALDTSLKTHLMKTNTDTQRHH